MKTSFEKKTGLKERKYDSEGWVAYPPEDYNTDYCIEIIGGKAHITGDYIDKTIVLEENQKLIIHGDKKLNKDKKYIGIGVKEQSNIDETLKDVTSLINDMLRINNCNLEIKIDIIK